MKILCIGDSWTSGYGIEKIENTWPYVLGTMTGSEIIVGARCGADNKSISINAKNLVKKHKPDLCIVGWSGVTRYSKRHDQFSLSYVLPELGQKRKKWFADHSMNDILEIWNSQIHEINNLSIPVLMFSVFGDRPNCSHKNFLKISFLEYLANKQGVIFKYDIPLFEFGFLHESNTVTENFAKKYFPETWQYACVEREQLRDTEYFFNCGHPNEKGHHAWAGYLKDTICQL
jgi:hypothetical protein